jgi:IclR family transcriptional regulator, KDG regulon repressor
MKVERSTAASSTPGASDSADARRYRIEAVSRAAHILDCIRADDTASVEALAARAEAPEPFVRSALGALERRGLARTRTDSPDQWALGLGWLRLAAAGRRQIDVRESAQPIMRRMREDVDETIILSVRRGNRRVTVEFVESTQNVRRIVDIGAEAPLYVGAAGRAILSGFPERELRGYLDTVAASDGTIIMGLGVDAYIAEIAKTHERGYAIAFGEFTPDLCAISTPILDHAGHVVAALAISFPTDRYTRELEIACVRVVKEAAREVSRLIGYVDPTTTTGAA